MRHRVRSRLRLVLDRACRRSRWPRGPAVGHCPQQQGWARGTQSRRWYVKSRFRCCCRGFLLPLLLVCRLSSRAAPYNPAAMRLIRGIKAIAASAKPNRDAPVWSRIGNTTPADAMCLSADHGCGNWRVDLGTNAAECQLATGQCPMPPDSFQCTLTSFYLNLLSTEIHMCDDYPLGFNSIG